MTGAAHKFELAAQLYAGIAAAVFTVSGILYLYLGYIPMTHQDFWQIYDILLNHTWLEGALLKFNGHSLFFPTGIWLLDLHLFHGSQELLFFIGLVLLILSVVVMAWPIWRDATIAKTTKFAAILVLAVGNFWMGRSFMLVSGAFNICYSLATGGAVLAFLYLPALREDLSKSRSAIFVILGAGVISTFSFGAGLVVWPTLLILAWCLKVPRRTVVLLGVVMVLIAAVYALLPSQLSHEPVLDTKAWFGSNLPTVLGQLCRLVGSPVYYTIGEWQAKTHAHDPTPTFMLAFWSGVVGLSLAAAALLPYLLHRNLFGKSLQGTGLALVLFNLLALVMIVISRNQHFQAIPNEVVAPRYVFWSSLYWAGLFLFALGATQRRTIARWLCLLVIFALPFLLWPEHMAEGFHWRYARISAEEDAISLINGMEDPQRKMFPDPEQVKRLTTQLRARRLDIFAPGWQDWIGQPAALLFPGPVDKKRFGGSATVTPVREGEKEPAEVVVKGNLGGKVFVPVAIVITDAKGTVAGIAVAPKMSEAFNRMLFRDRGPQGKLTGYISHYDPRESYLLRAVRGQSLSQKSIAIPPMLR